MERRLLNPIARVSYLYAYGTVRVLVRVAPAAKLDSVRFDACTPRPRPFLCNLLNSTSTSMVCVRVLDITRRRELEIIGSVCLRHQNDVGTNRARAQVDAHLDISIPGFLQRFLDVYPGKNSKVMIVQLFKSPSAFLNGDPFIIKSRWSAPSRMFPLQQDPSSAMQLERGWSIARSRIYRLRQKLSLI